MFARSGDFFRSHANELPGKKPTSVLLQWVAGAVYIIILCICYPIDIVNSFYSPCLNSSPSISSFQPFVERRTINAIVPVDKVCDKSATTTTNPFWFTPYLPHQRIRNNYHYYVTLYAFRLRCCLLTSIYNIYWYVFATMEAAAAERFTADVVIKNDRRRWRAYNKIMHYALYMYIYVI